MAKKTHKQKVKLANKMRTPAERRKGEGHKNLFDSAQWSKQRNAKAERLEIKRNEKLIGMRRPKR